MKIFKGLLSCVLLSSPFYLIAQNQTPTVSPVFSGDELPFEVKVETAGFQLPFGIQSHAVGVYKEKWLFITGRLNGLHGFNNDPNNFPPNEQNRYVIVVDYKKQKVTYRSLDDPQSGLTSDQADSLAVTAAQFYQSGKTLYVSGGYGFQTSTAEYITWPILSAIHIPGLIEWVEHPDSDLLASEFIRQVSHPLLAVTGGYMDRLGGKKSPTLLVFGQDFEGTYAFGVHSQEYTQQVRSFRILDKKNHLKVEFIDPNPLLQNPDFRRRDLNIVRVLRPSHHQLKKKLVALAGVFTQTDGIWTVPVKISSNGCTLTDDPTLPATFKQSLNIYNAANIGLFSKKTGEMFNVLFGGITYQYFLNGQPQFDTEFPFTNQLAAIRISPEGVFTQHLLRGEYPLIPSTGSNPGNPLLFGATAQFIPSCNISQIVHDVIDLDRIKKEKTIGHIVGGIMSTLPNTNTASDSAASPYIFKVKLIPRDGSCS